MYNEFDDIILRSLEEDAAFGDITTDVTVAGDATASGVFRAKESGVLCGIDIARRTFELVGGEVAFLMLSAAVGIFGISGTGVAQAQIIHELFLPMVQSLNIAMPIWGMVVLVGCQVTFFVTPTVDMVGQMGLARSKNIKAMLANGWVITVITFAYVLIRAILYTM